MTNLESILKSRDITLPTKVCIVKSYGFSSSHVWIWELDHKVSWALKNWCFQTMGLEKTPEIPWDSKEIKPVNPKENQPWIFIERTDAKAEAPIFWPPDVKSWFTRKDPNTGKYWCQEEVTTENEMVGWCHWWLWVCASSGSWWWTGKPGMLQSMGSQRVGHNWMIELNWTELLYIFQTV